MLVTLAVGGDAIDDSTAIGVHQTAQKAIRSEVQGKSALPLLEDDGTTMFHAGAVLWKETRPMH